MDQYRQKRLAADGQVNGTAPAHVWAVLFVNAATPIDATLKLHDAATAAGDPKLDMQLAAEQGQVFLDLRSIGGLAFSTACFADVTGAGTIIHVWWE